MSINKGIQQLEITTVKHIEIEEKYLLFKESAEKIAAEIYRFEKAAQGTAKIQDIIKELEAEQVVAAPSNNVRALELEQIKGIKLNFDRQEALKAQVGICSGEFAVAETGSLCQVDPTLEERWASSLPEVNIVLVHTGQLVGTFKEAMERIYRETRLPGYVSFITGPSRTSDIERVLTIGVHGPRRLIIIFIDDLKGGNCHGNQGV